MAGVHASVALPEPRKMNAPVPVQQRQNPRRTPLREMKLLPGSKKQKLTHSPDETTTPLDPLTQLKSQGSGSDQSATHWFDSVNKHGPQNAHRNAEYDDEPPFFISNQNNYRPNSFEPSEGSRLFGAQSRLDSENEELRGVIDDLTIENKRLMHVLRANQRSQRNSPSTEGQDKLFEVRMHGLTPEKRRELEFLLKNFATSVHNSVPSMPNSTAGSGVSSNSVANNYPGKAKTDSGYASNSTSGQPSMLNSHGTRALTGVSQSVRDKNIKSYLHDIPDTLLPRQQPMVMSERARMALVVRRLEQLFTGRNAAPGEHSQPLQQQEVSQMAARADARNSKKRKAEGTREAHILPPESKFNFDTVDTGLEKRKRRDAKSIDSNQSTEGMTSTASRPGSPDQRPTRPLDLDIHRAQVAAENIDYIRHLGLSSPHLDSSEVSDSWMFLNLLISMAQLHTVNVTPEFVRRAIKKLSSKFELSKDGHKVRWVGGPGATVFSKEEEKALEAVDTKDEQSNDELNDDSGTGGSSKRSKTDSNSNAVASNDPTSSEDKSSGLNTSNASKQQISTDATSNQLSSNRTKPTKSISAFDYKPIVYRGRAPDLMLEESYLQDSDSSLGGTSGDSSGLAHRLSRSNLNQQRKSDEGLITFYNNPFFCSDYSGDKMPHNMLAERDILPGTLLGPHPREEVNQQASRLAEACYFTPQYCPVRFSPSQLEKIPTLEIEPFSSAGEIETQPMELVASGLGHVVPDDNFAIDVKVLRTKASPNKEPTIMRQVPHTGSRLKAKYTYLYCSQNKIDLLPSRLPPASYIFFTSGSSSGNQVEEDDDDDSSEDSDESSSSADIDNPPPLTFLQHWSTERSGDMETVDDDDDQDDSSMDMLAAARAVDPERIAEQERQYMINQPGGRAVAGSLAATVGASQSSTSADDIESDRADFPSDSEDDMEVDED